MKLSNSFIAVKKITSSIPRSNFSEDELNRAAELILKVEGIINPLVLRRTSPQSYDVFDGHFEYYAAARAKEIDSQKGEYIGSFIIEPENEQVLQEQVEILRRRESSDNEIEQKLEHLNTQVSQLAESVRRIENILGEKQKAKRSKPQKTHTQTSKYDSMTVSQLKPIAKELKIEGYSKMKKGQLIAAITSNKED
jgi:ParB family chromosome partitioning protein